MTTGLIQFPTSPFLDANGKISKAWTLWLQNPNFVHFNADSASKLSQASLLPAGTTATTLPITDNTANVATTAFVQGLITGSGVASFNTRTGVVTLNSTDIINALGFSPIGANSVIPGMDGQDGDDGQIGPPGQAGVAGANGVSGLSLTVHAFDALDGEDGLMGPPGQSGINGATGSQGAQGVNMMALDGLDGEQGDRGPQGIQGIQGVAGPAGSIGFSFDGEEGVEGFAIPGPVGPSGAAGFLAFNGGLTGNTTINDTVTYTTGGATLTNQSAAIGAVWRVKAQGTFVAVSSATARNAQIAPFWGSTQLPAIAVVVLASVAQTTNWFAEFILTASSTTAIWTTGLIQNKFDYPAIVAGTSSADKTDLATPASTTVTAGNQTLDLRFSMSVAVATDQWVIQNVTMERLK